MLNSGQLFDNGKEDDNELGILNIYYCIRFNDNSRNLGTCDKQNEARRKIFHSCDTGIIVLGYNGNFVLYCSNAASLVIIIERKGCKNGKIFKHADC